MQEQDTKTRFIELNEKLQKMHEDNSDLFDVAKVIGHMSVLIVPGNSSILPSLTVKKNKKTANGSNNRRCRFSCSF